MSTRAVFQYSLGIVIGALMSAYFIDLGMSTAKKAAFSGYGYVSCSGN